MADRRITAMLTVLAAVAGGCESDDASNRSDPPSGSVESSSAADVVVPEGFERVVARLEPSGAGDEGVELDVWLAGDPAQWQRGLTGVTDLDGADGMLFVFDEAGGYRFYMWQTPMPLDIHFFDAARRFVGAETMAPCLAETSDSCERYSPDVLFLAALETPAGALEALSVDETWTLSFGAATAESPVPLSTG